MARALDWVAIEFGLVLSPPVLRVDAIPELDAGRFEPQPEFGRALRAVVGILAETREHHRFERGWDRYPSRRQRHRFLVEVLRANLNDRLAIEDIHPCEQIIGDCAQRVD